MPTLVVSPKLVVVGFSHYLKNFNGGDVFAAYTGLFCLQILGFFAAAVLMSRMDVNGFRRSV